MSAPRLIPLSGFANLLKLQLAIFSRTQRTRGWFSRRKRTVDRLAESIDQEGILVPLVVYEDPEQEGKYILIDGERRLRCALTLGLQTVPAVVTSPRSKRENLVQMFNIHLIREPWQDMPTAWALAKLIDELRLAGNDREPSVKELCTYWPVPGTDPPVPARPCIARRSAIHPNEGEIPLNFFWELDRHVIRPLATRRPKIAEQLDEFTVREAFVNKRLDSVVTDTVSFRDVHSIINLAGGKGCRR